MPPVRDGTGFAVTVLRPDGRGQREARWSPPSAAMAKALGDAPVTFKPGQMRGERHIALPLEIRNQTARLEIRGEDSAGAVQLLDSGGVERRAGHRLGRHRGK